MLGATLAGTLNNTVVPQIQSQPLGPVNARCWSIHFIIYNKSPHAVAEFDALLASVRADRASQQGDWDKQQQEAAAERERLVAEHVGRFGAHRVAVDEATAAAIELHKARLPGHPSIIVMSECNRRGYPPWLFPRLSNFFVGVVFDAGKANVRNTEALRARTRDKQHSNTARAWQQ